MVIDACPRAPQREAAQRPLLEQPRVRRPATQEQLVVDGRPVPAIPAGGLDQVPGPEILQTESVARREVGHFALP